MRIKVEIIMRIKVASLIQDEQTDPSFYLYWDLMNIWSAERKESNYYYGGKVNPCLKESFLTALGDSDNILTIHNSDLYAKFLRYVLLQDIHEVV